MDHVKYATNGGIILPAMTVFPARVPGRKDVVRVWNKQIISFAGYENDDGTVTGDKSNVDFTKVSYVLTCSVS